MEKQYNHSDHESRIYDFWEDQKAFLPSKDGKETFTILMPPPNANDPLHVGHAMFVTIEDVLVRYNRMKGKSTLWLPGTDHAGIETQFVFEKKLAKQGKSRFQFDRETLYSMIWDYVQENSDVAVEQLKRIGASADWSRFTFMLDEEVVKIVLETFQQLHEDGLVYRSEKLVNYCTKCGTAFSELEVVHEERISPFFTIKYGPFEIGTVRPETKFRDTALAVNPQDTRYKNHIGKTFEIMGLLGPISMKVIADSEVDPEFGTGIMKVTPAHDPHDFELGKKHNLPVTPIVGFDGKMDFSWFIDDPNNAGSKYLERAKKYHRLSVANMRTEMKKDLEEDGLLVNYNPNYTHAIGTCYRCSRVLEPLPLPQFFVRVKPLTERVLQALDNKEVIVYGSGHDKILKHWLNNLRDWNVSRQIVWGIRLPVWYDTTNNKNVNMVVGFVDNNNETHHGALIDLLTTHSLEEINKGLTSLQAPPHADYVISQTKPGDDYLQETDTFDTWFSSAQWPYTTLQTNRKGDFERFYPTQVMETGYDILPFWVMRMLMMGFYKTKKLWGEGNEKPPFENVYLHGLVRDEHGKKMSKSKGNVINPIDVIEKYGADALRMALVMSTSAGKDSNTGETKIRGMRNFTNKIWNAVRFITMLTDENETDTTLSDDDFKERLGKIVDEVTDHLDNYRIGLAAEVVYNQFWHWFCDECIEQTKSGTLSKTTLLFGLEVFLKLLHPFVPFVTEVVYGVLRDEKLIVSPTPLIISNWPKQINTQETS